MKILFNSLSEIKEFILMVDLYQLCDKDPEWGGLGYIITDKEEYYEEKEVTIVTKPHESRVYNNRDTVIVTPYYKQISWLFRTLYEFVNEKKELDVETFLTGFGVGCKGYFLINPNYYPQELMLFILDGLQRVLNSRSESKEQE